MLIGPQDNIFSHGNLICVVTSLVLRYKQSPVPANSLLQCVSWKALLGLTDLFYKRGVVCGRTCAAFKLCLLNGSCD